VGPYTCHRPRRVRDRRGTRARTRPRKVGARDTAGGFRNAPCDPSATCRAPQSQAAVGRPRPHRGAQCAGASPRVPAAGAGGGGSGGGGGGGGGSDFSLGWRLRRRRGERRWWSRGEGSDEGDGDAEPMRRRPAGRAEARRRRRLRGHPPPGEGRPQGWLRGSGLGRGPRQAGALVGSSEKDRGKSGSREERDWRPGGAGEGRRREVPAEPRGASPPASHRCPRRALPFCPRSRGSQIGRETARGPAGDRGGVGAHLAPRRCSQLGGAVRGAEPRRGRPSPSGWAGWSLSADRGPGLLGVRRAGPFGAFSIPVPTPASASCRGMGAGLFEGWKRDRGGREDWAQRLWINNAFSLLEMTFFSLCETFGTLLFIVLAGVSGFKIERWR
jgi:hypothetical protein